MLNYYHSWDKFVNTHLSRSNIHLLLLLTITFTDTSKASEIVKILQAESARVIFVGETVEQ